MLETLLRVELSHHCLFVFGNAVLFVNPKIHPEGAAPLSEILRVGGVSLTGIMEPPMIGVLEPV